MKYYRIYAAVTALSLIFLSIFIRDREERLPTSYATALQTLPTIIVDAGHGGIDGGTSGADGTTEKDINLAVAKRVESFLVSFGFQVVMTRTADDLISDPTLETIRERKRQDILKRLEIAQKPNHVLISIHQNHYGDTKYYGTQVFYSKNHEDSILLAKALQKQITSLLQPDNTRQVKAVGAEIYLLNECENPSVMVECGFLSNPKELSLLKNETYQSQMAFAIAVSLLNFYT